MEMEQKQGGVMNISKRKLLLIEYGKIVLKEIEGVKLPSTDSDIVRMKKIQEILGLDHDGVMREVSEYLEGTVSRD